MSKNLNSEWWNDSNPSLWKRVKEFINNIPINQTFTRKESLEKCYRKSGYKKNDATAVDTYINLLRHSGFIEHVGRGLRKKIFNIPPSLTLTDLRLFSEHIGKQPDSFKWFIVDKHEYFIQFMKNRYEKILSEFESSEKVNKNDR